MKKIYYLIFIIFFLGSCSTTTQLVNKKNLDWDISYSPNNETNENTNLSNNIFDEEENIDLKKQLKNKLTVDLNEDLQNLLTKNFKNSENFNENNNFLASLEIKNINNSNVIPELKKINFNIKETLSTKENAEKTILKNNYNLKNVLAARKKYKNLKKYFEKNQKNTDGDCDNLVYKNGNEVSAKIIEISTDIVKYKRCNNLNGPVISVKKSELLLIRYSNGEKELFTDYKEESSEEVNQKVKTFNMLSIVFSSLSIIFTLFISILLGIILLIPALIFLGLGSAAKKK